MYHNNLILLFYCIHLSYAENCFSAAQIAGIIFVSSFTTFFAVVAIAILVWCFYRQYSQEKDVVIESGFERSERATWLKTLDAENRTSQAATSSSLHVDRAVNHGYQDIDITQIESCRLSRKDPNHPFKCSIIQSSNSNETLKDVVRCLLTKDTNALGFQIIQSSNGICISHVHPDGPAQRSGNIFVGDRIRELTVTFENMALQDALTLLSCASTYSIRLELERAITESQKKKEPFSVTKLLVKYHSSPDLREQNNETLMRNRGSFMSNQKYALPQRETVMLESEGNNRASVTDELLPPSNKEGKNSEEMITSSCIFGIPKSEIPNRSTHSSLIQSSKKHSSNLSIPSSSTLSKPASMSCSHISSTGTESWTTINTGSFDEKHKSKISTSSQNCFKNTDFSEKSSETQSLSSTISTPSTSRSTPTRIPSPYTTRYPRPVLSLSPDQLRKDQKHSADTVTEIIEKKYRFLSTSTTPQQTSNQVEFCEAFEPKRESIVIEFQEDHTADTENVQRSKIESFREVEFNESEDIIKKNGVHEEKIGEKDENNKTLLPTIINGDNQYEREKQPNVITSEKTPHIIKESKLPISTSDTLKCDTTKFSMDNRLNGTHTTLKRSKTANDVLKEEINGASLYIAKKEALRKTCFLQSKCIRSDDQDLGKERWERLNANQVLLQRQQDELRALGVLP